MADRPLSVFEHHLHVLDLAFEYLSVDPSQKQKIIELVDKKTQEDENFSILDIFKEESLISDEDMGHLKVFDEHIHALCQDHQFGKIAVANGMASAKDVESALAYQKSQFEKYRINMLIGDILVEKKVISPADRMSVLLTQNRIKDEQLCDALDQIGATIAEKDLINKRFGVLAIKKALVTIQQVNEALEVQLKERETEGKSRFIGRILQETAGLSDEDVHSVLAAQKQFEKRRLDLEKALYSLKSEMKISKKMGKIFGHALSPDGVELSVKKLKETDPPVSLYEFIIWLRRIGVKYGLADDADLEDFLQNGDKNASIVVAKGIAPIPGTEERIEYFFENEETAAVPEEGADETRGAEDETGEESGKERDKAEPEEEQEEEKKGPEESEKEASADSADSEEPEETTEAGDDQKESSETDSREQTASEQGEEDEPSEESEKPGNDGDHESGSEPAQEDGKKEEIDTERPVTPGVLLARIVPGKPGRTGRDVLGRPVQPSPMPRVVLNAGSGVVRKGAGFYAQKKGFPMLDEGVLKIEPLVKKAEHKTLDRHISSDSKDAYSLDDVELHGNIMKAGVLRCRHLNLFGNIEGSVVCTGDMEIKGSIGLDEKPAEDGTVHQAAVICQGSLKVSKSVFNARIQISGEFKGFNAKVRGSQLIAARGMTIRDVLTAPHAPCVLWFGLEPGDKMLTIDQTIETKSAELTVLKRQDEIDEMTHKYELDLEEERQHQFEQAILENLKEIVEAPELYQYDGIEKKIKYLRGLPDFSSIKTGYLKLPETGEADAFIKEISAATEGASEEKTLEYLRSKLEGESEESDREEKTGESGEDEETEAPVKYDLETQFNARMSALKSEIDQNAEQIEKLETDVNGLQNLRKKLGAAHAAALSPSSPEIAIRNTCDKGTVIRGRVSKLVLDQTMYNVRFKEVVNPRTGTPYITVLSY